MKWKRVVLPALSAAMLVSARSVEHSTVIQPEGFSLPPVYRETLPNGVRFFHVRDDLPQLTLVVSIGMGKLHETGDDAGISELIAKAITIGGSARYPGNSLHDAIEAMGGRLSIVSSWETTTITVKVLDRFKNEAFAIAADLLAHPILAPPSLDNARSIVADAIARKADDPAEIAFERARAIIFEGVGYGSVPTPAIIRTLPVQRIQDYWARRAVGGNLMVGVTSSIDAAEASRLCRAHFGLIPQGSEAQYEADISRLRSVVARSRGKIFFYPKEIPQATVVVGTAAPAIGGEGEQALEIMNYLLGGGSFSSRLVSEIRVKRGLAYTVQSILRLRRGIGVFLAFAQTENRSAGEVLDLLMKGVAGMPRAEVSASEVAWARNAISNSFIFRFDTPNHILSNEMERAYYRLPEDYFNSYRARLAAVTQADVLRESGRLLRDGLVAVVVGSRAVEEQMKKRGEVVVIH